MNAAYKFYYTLIYANYEFYCTALISSIIMAFIYFIVQIL
jgi:hypothetical protein